MIIWEYLGLITQEAPFAQFMKTFISFCLYVSSSYFAFLGV